MNLMRILFFGLIFGTFSYGTNQSAEDHEPFYPYLDHIPINNQEERYRSYKKQMHDHRMREEQKLVIGKREREEPIADRDLRYRMENHDGPSLTPPPLRLPSPDLVTDNVYRSLDFNATAEEQLEKKCQKLDIKEPTHDYCVSRKASLPFGK